MSTIFSGSVLPAYGSAAGALGSVAAWVLGFVGLVFAGYVVAFVTLLGVGQVRGRAATLAAHAVPERLGTALATVPIGPDELDQLRVPVELPLGAVTDSVPDRGESGAEPVQVSPGGLAPVAVTTA